MPYRDNGHLTAGQKKYNVRRSANRSIIERAFRGGTKGEVPPSESSWHHGNIYLVSMCTTKHSVCASVKFGSLLCSNRKRALSNHSFCMWMLSPVATVKYNRDQMLLWTLHRDSSGEQCELCCTVVAAITDADCPCEQTEEIWTGPSQWRPVKWLSSPPRI